MHKHQHPDSETLDRLRAGLLDDRAEEKAAIEAHLATCEHCRATADIWQQLDPNALGPEVDHAELEQALAAARRQALSQGSSSATHVRRLLPYAAAATLVLAITVGLWTIQPGVDTNGMLGDNTEAVPDIYEDLDFYLWLATQEDNNTGNGST